jgi:type IV secretory pathway VirB2 component (pilin)
VAGKFIEVLTGRTFLMMAGWALVSSAVSYASTSTTGLPWETPLQTVKQSLTGPVAAGIATAVIVGAGTIMSTLFSSSSAVIAMTGGF